MSATITRFPGKEPPKKLESEDLAHATSPAAATEATTLARLTDFYRNYDGLPLDRIGSDSIAAITKALTEERYKDAMDLVDIVVEGVRLSDEGFGADTEEVLTSPIPEAAEVWRFGDPTARPPQPRLHSVHYPADKEILHAAMTLKSDVESDWSISCGELLFNEVGEASLTLGLKGELFLLLFSGAATVSTLDQEVVASASCGDAQACLHKMIYCRARHNHERLVLTIETDAASPARGIWCHSSRLGLNDQERFDDPDNQDIFFLQAFHSIALDGPSETGFCANAKRVKPGKKYAHKESWRRGEFALFDFASGDLSGPGDWTAEAWSKETRVRGFLAGTHPRRGNANPRRRQLDEHCGGMEFLVAIEGLTWVVVAPEPPSGPSDDRDDLYFYTERQPANGALRPWMTPLTAAGEIGHDVMLLNSSYSHTVWMTPDSGARFLHICFEDPCDIKPIRVGDHELQREPAENPRRRAAG